jgi:hypothetical protein
VQERVDHASVPAAGQHDETFFSEVDDDCLVVVDPRVQKTVKSRWRNAPKRLLRTSTS